MVVEGAIRFGNMGAGSLEKRDWETAHLSLGKSRDFVAEMIGGLSEKHDPGLTASMKQLFFFAYVNLAEGDRDRDLKKVRDALKILQMHHATWVDLAEHLKPVPPAGSASAKSSGEPRAWSA
jgi:flagellar secretion chaperone FliS